MRDICENCKRREYCLEPCEAWLIAHDQCPVCHNRLIHLGGCMECIAGDWAQCG